MNVLESRGYERERDLDRAAYFNEGYFSLPQLLSMSQQLHEIHKLKPRNILEIGIGNGFVSSFLSAAGYPVTTADINPALNADVCAPLDQLPQRFGAREFDLVVCCEVLEHMPLDQLAPNLDYLRYLGDRLFLTLPNFNRVFGVGGMVRLPKLENRPVGMHIEVPVGKTLDKEHFWEVGFSAGCTKSAIRKLLLERFEKVECPPFVLTPRHLCFYAS